MLKTAFKYPAYAFFGSDHIAVNMLKVLLNMHCPPQCIYTGPDKKRGRGNMMQKNPVAVMAEKNCISYSIKLPQHIKEHYAFIVSYGRILPISIFQYCPFGAWNLHFSILPQYRGPAPVQQAILDHQTISGISIIKINNTTDAGDILYTEKYSINQNAYREKIYADMIDIGAQAYINMLENPKKFLQNSQIQNDTDVSYTKKFHAKDGYVSFQDSNAEYIYAIFRALYGQISIYFLYNNLAIKIHAMCIQQINTVSQTPGSVVSCSKDLIMQCKKGYAVLKTLQLPGKKICSFAHLHCGALRHIHLRDIL